MSHDASNPPEDREFNELFRAANSNQSGHAPNNTKLNSVKNNPSKQSVKHSDFFVSSVSRDLSCSRNHFFRSETVDVSVVFSGMNVGFRDEIRHNPNNFTWYVNNNSKHLLKIEPYSINRNDNTVWKDGGTGAYKITIRHVGNNCYEDEDAWIHCKFKDDFNETIGASKGYNVELTFKITCKALAFESETYYQSNGNSSNAYAYDNELEIPSRQTGMNKRKYYKSKAIDGRKLISTLGDDQDVILKTSYIHGQSTLANSLIDKVTVEWEKYDEDRSKWVLISLTDKRHYLPYVHTGSEAMGNVGQLEKWYDNNHYTSKDTSGRLNIQGLNGTGKWRAKLTITGDPENRFTCVVHTNYREIRIYERIAPFTLQGQGWECNGVDAVLNVNPVVQERDSWQSADKISNTLIRYRLYQHTGVNVKYIGYIDRDDNGANSFQFKIKNDGYYSVQATWIRKTFTGSIIYGDTVPRGYGTRWSTDRINTDNNSKDTNTTLSSWYNRASYIRRTLTPPSGPAEWTMTWENMSRTDATWNWTHIGTQSASYRTYIVRAYHRDSSKTSGDEGYIQIHNWKDIGDINKWNVNKLFPPRDTHGGKTDSFLQVKVKITGDLSKIAPGDTSATCLGPVTTKYHQPIGCVHISPRMPVPALSTTSTMLGRLDPTLRIDWGALNTWNSSSQALADLKRTTRENWCHVSWKYADESDETVDSHWRDQVKGWDGAKNIGGLWYSNIEDRRAFSADFVYERAVIVRYRVITYYHSDDLSCKSTIHERIHRTIDPNRVYSYTPGTSVPANFEKKKHYGFVTASDTRTAGSAPATWNNLAFGVGMNCITGVHVSLMHQSATINKYKNGAVHFNRASCVDTNGFTMPGIDVTTKSGSTVLKGTYDIKQTDTTVYKHEAIGTLPPYTLSINNRYAVRSHQGKDFYQSNTISFSRRVTK